MSYLQTLKADAIKVWHSHQILPSICAAQASLESGSGTSRLAKPPYNNHFGIKASADWTGRKVTMLTGEHVNGGRIEIYADFRAYDTIYDSIADYAAFFTGTPWRKENYKHVVGETDYKKAANALRASGYATDPQYPTKLIRIIENNNLQAWDREALASAGGSSPTNQTIASQYDASKANGATAVSTNGWNLTEVNQFLMNSVDPPYVNGAYINKFLSTYYSDSPLIGQGDTIKEMSDYYGISVGAAMGVWAKESTFGRGHPGKVDHNYGCIKWTSGSGYPSVTYDGIQWNKYPSKKVGIAAWFSLVRNNYVELGYHRYSNFLDRYSPTGDSNVHATFKNLMWGVLKSFGYNMTNTATKFNHSKPSDNPSTVSPPKTGITQPPAGVGSTSQSKPINKLVGGQLTSAVEKFARENGASWIGDSLMVGTEPHAKKMSPGSNFDGLGSRQITHATPSLNATTVLKNMINAGTLKSIIIFVIGTNRGVTRAEIDAVMTLIGSERKIIFVSTASEVNHSAGVAGEYRSASDRYQNAFYADWHQEGRAKREVYYTPDGAGGKRIHMTSEGYKAHANYLTAAWYEVATADYTQDVAVAAPVTYYDVEDFELNENGIITYYENTKQVTGADGKVTLMPEEKTHDTGIKGFYSPKGDKYVYYPESNNRWSHGGEAGTPTWIDTIYTNDKTSSAVELIEGAMQDLIEKSEPASQYTISLLDVNKDLSIGDYGVFIDHNYNPPLYIEARILSISTSLTDQTANTVVIGNVTELVQKENPDITALKAELQNNRSEIKKEMQSQNPITATLFSTNGYMLGDAHKETQLILKLFQGTKEVTDQYNKFEWERTSSDSVSDEKFNKLLEVEKSNTIKVYNRDIMNNQSVFIGRAYSNSGGLMKQAEVKLSFSDTALWNGSDSEPTDAVDGSTWTKPDGTQWIKKDGVWEEKVDQEVISQVRVEVEGAMAEAEQARADAVKAYEDAVAEAKRLADEADALIRAEIEQEVGNIGEEMEQDKQDAIIATNQALADAKAHAIAQDTLIKNQIATEVGTIGDEMEQAKQDAITATNQALIDAKTHAIAQDATLKTLLQGEIDGAEAEALAAKQAAQDAYTNALTDAKAHAEAEDSRIRGELESDIGGAIDLAEQAKQDAIDEADQALVDAKAHAVAQDVLLKQAIGLEIDGAIDIAEQAKRDASTKAQTAYDEAVAEADRLAGLRDDGITITAGQITAGVIDAARLNASAIVTSGLTANVIKSTHIQSDTLLVDKIFASQILVNHLWSKAIWANKITTMELNASQIKAGTIATARLNAVDIVTNGLTANVISAAHINGNTALFDKLFSTTLATDRLVARGAWITSANISSLDAGKITAGTIATARLNAVDIVTSGLTADVIKSTHIKTDVLLVDKIFANQIMVDRLWAKEIWSNKITTMELNASQIKAGTIATARLNASDIVTSGLTANVIKSTYIQADELLVDKVFANQASIDRLWAKTIWANKITTMELNASQIKAGTINAARLNASAIVTAGLTANVVKATHIQADELLVDKVFANQASIDRLWAKTIWANKITTIKLNASQIDAGTINAARLNVKEIVTNGLSTDVVTSTHIKASEALINTIFGDTAYINKLTSKTAFINNIKAISIDVDKITGNYATFLKTAWQSLNSRATVDGNRIRIDNVSGDFIEMNNIPELRSSDEVGTSVVLGKGRVHFYDSAGNSKGYVGTDIHTIGNRDFGTFLSKGGGTYRFARMAPARTLAYNEYTVPAGRTDRVTIIEDMVRAGLLPDGNEAQFVQKSNMIAGFHGWPKLPGAWPTQVAGNKIRYSEKTVATTGDAYHTGWMYTLSNSVNDVWKFYVNDDVVFNGAYGASSDRRLKHDIESSQIDALSHIESLSFKEFSWNKNGKFEPLGVIAQDSGILRIPSNNPDEMESIDGFRSSLLALKGVQELQKIVMEQAEEIKQLKGKINK